MGPKEKNLFLTLFLKKNWLFFSATDSDF